MSERAGDGGWFSSAFEQTGPVQDETFIRYGIMAAAREERLIGDATARVIAAQLHSGQISALCSLAATGAIVEGLEAQLRPDQPAGRSGAMDRSLRGIHPDVGRSRSDRRLADLMANSADREA